MTYAIHIANVLYLISYLVRDILWLRILTVVAIICLMPYFYFQPQPLYEPISWNVVFAGINIVQIYILFLERRPVKLNEDEERLYLIAFRCLRRREFKRLLELGDWWNLPAGTLLLKQEEEPEGMIILMEGDVCAYRNDQIVARLRPGQFLGEMAFFTGKKAEVDIWTNSEVKMYCWRKPELLRFLDRNQKIRAAIQTTLGRDLSAKLLQTHSEKEKA